MRLGKYRPTRLAAVTLAALTATPLLAQIAPGGSHAVDLDGDGLLDRVVFELEQTLVERNLGAGQWQCADVLPAMQAHAVLADDLDADGVLDLLVLAAAGTHALLGRGAGRFDAAPEHVGLSDLGPAHAAQRLDLDGDGLPDLLLRGETGDVFVYAVAGARGLRYERDPATPGLDDGTFAAWSALQAADSLFGGSAPPQLLTDLAAVLLERLVRPESWTDPTFASAAPPASFTPSAGLVAGPPAVLGLGEALAHELFVDDDMGEVGTLDIPDGSLNGGDVSTSGGNVYHLGRLGIGIADPQYDMHVLGGSYATVGESVARVVVAPKDTFMATSGDSELWLTGDEDATSGAVLAYEDAAAEFQLRGLVPWAITPPVLTADAVYGQVGVNTSEPDAALGIVEAPSSDAMLRCRDATGKTVFRVWNDGRAGVGTGSPNAALGIRQVPSTTTLLRCMDASKSTVFRVFDDGRAGVGTGSPNAALGVRQVPSTTTLFRAMDADGDTVMRITQTGRVIASALEITGGGDLVEAFESSVGELPAGTVVCVDPDEPGRVLPCRSPYDTRVVGAVSGANGVSHGIRMVQEGVLEGDVPVAMTGRIWVRCSTESGPIAPGDRLTTSSVEGHAMRAADAARCPGAVIGKALSRLESGEGLVLVLVNLQ